MFSSRSVLVVLVCLMLLPAEYTLPVAQAQNTSWIEQIFQDNAAEKRRRQRLRRAREAARKRRAEAAARRKRAEAEKRRQAEQRQKQNNDNQRDEQQSPQDRRSEIDQSNWYQHQQRLREAARRKSKNVTLPPEASEYDEDPRDEAPDEDDRRDADKKAKEKAKKKKIEINFYKDDERKRRRNPQIYRKRRQKGEARTVSIRMREDSRFIDKTYVGDIGRAFYQQVQSDLISFQGCRNDQQECKRIREKLMPGALLKNTDKTRYRGSYATYGFNKAELCLGKKFENPLLPRMGRRMHRDFQFVMEYQYNDANIQELKLLFGLPEDYAVYVQSVEAKFDNLYLDNPLAFRVAEFAEAAVMNCDLLMVDYKKLKLVRRIEYGNVFIGLHVVNSAPPAEIKKMVRAMQNFVGYNLWIRYNARTQTIELRSNKDDLMIGMHAQDWSVLHDHKLRDAIMRERQYVRQ